MTTRNSIPLSDGGLLIAPNKENTPIPSWVNRLRLTLLILALFLEAFVLGENKLLSVLLGPWRMSWGKRGDVGSAGNWEPKPIGHRDWFLSWTTRVSTEAAIQTSQVFRPDHSTVSLLTQTPQKDGKSETPAKSHSDSWPKITPRHCIFID